MNIGLYLEEPLAAQVLRYAEKMKTTRNAIIRQALKVWMDEHDESEWPASILNFKGISDFPAFEDGRQDLLPPNEDPLA